jgi:ABC-2 type transport system ATP-binding protein
MVKTSTLAIKTTHISKSYGNNQSLKSLDLQITAGEIFGLLGHNGAGKTTIVNILTTLLQPTSGTAEIFGYDIQKESQQARKLLGYLPENVRFYDNMTAYENVEYLEKLSGMSTPKKRILEVF